MKREPFLDVVLAAVLLCVAAVCAFGAYLDYADVRICAGGVPCDFSDLYGRSVSLPLSLGAAVLFLLIAVRLLQGVWRGR